MPGLAYIGDDNDLQNRITGLCDDYKAYMRRREEEERVKRYTSQLALVATAEAAVLVQTEIQNVDMSWTKCDTLLDSGALGSSYASQLWVQEHPEAILERRNIDFEVKFVIRALLKN